MTESDPQTRAALLELAALDVCGLLDDYERSRFDREFHDAPMSLREDVIRLQAELAADTSLLPGVEPDEALRERVLAAVSGAIDAETSRLAPLATIGRARRDQDEVEQRRWMFSAAAMWRAAAFALAAATIVMGYMLNGAYNKVSEIAGAALDNQAQDDLLALVGPRVFDFVRNDECRSLDLQRAEGVTQGTGAVYINTIPDEETGELTVALLVVDMPRLEDGEQYTIRATTADGKTRLVESRFAGRGKASGPVVNVRAGVTVEELVACRWEIRDANNKLVLYA